MKLYFEEYQYPLNLLQDNLGDEVNLSRQNDKANIPYVGYYYNAKINDTVFILPKVFISEKGKAFDRYNPEDIIDISSDDGDTWTRAPYIVRPKKTPVGIVKMIQPTLWEDENGVFHALMRSDNGFVYKSESSDGIKWTKAEKTDLLNNNSGLDCVKAQDGNIYLVCNPVGENWGERSPLVLMKSTDNGKTFSVIKTLEEREGGEFSYPAIIADKNILHISYTFDRKNIVYCNFNIDSI